MIYCNIIDEINNVLSETVFKSVGARLYGIAELITRDKHTEPGIVDGNGEVQYVGMDDIYPVTVYHRLISDSTQPTRLGFGDAQWHRQTIRMRCVVFATKKNIKVDMTTLLNEMAMRIPIKISRERLQSLNLRAVKVAAGEKISHTPIVFRDEYNLPLDHRPDVSMGALTYSIEVLYDPACIAGVCVSKTN